MSNPLFPGASPLFSPDDDGVQSANYRDIPQAPTIATLGHSQLTEGFPSSSAPLQWPTSRPPAAARHLRPSPRPGYITLGRPISPSYYRNQNPAYRTPASGMDSLPRQMGAPQYGTDAHRDPQATTDFRPQGEPSYSEPMTMMRRQWGQAWSPQANDDASAYDTQRQRYYHADPDRTASFYDAFYALHHPSSSSSVEWTDPFSYWNRQNAPPQLSSQSGLPYSPQQQLWSHRSNDPSQGYYVSSPPPYYYDPSQQRLGSSSYERQTGPTFLHATTQNPQSCSSSHQYDWGGEQQRPRYTTTGLSDLHNDSSFGLLFDIPHQEEGSILMPLRGSEPRTGYQEEDVLQQRPAEADQQRPSTSRQTYYRPSAAASHDHADEEGPAIDIYRQLPSVWPTCAYARPPGAAAPPPPLELQEPLSRPTFSPSPYMGPPPRERRSNLITSMMDRFLYPEGESASTTRPSGQLFPPLLFGSALTQRILPDPNNSPSETSAQPLPNPAVASTAPPSSRAKAAPAQSILQQLLKYRAPARPSPPARRSQPAAAGSVVQPSVVAKSRASLFERMYRRRQMKAANAVRILGRLRKSRARQKKASLQMGRRSNSSAAVAGRRASRVATTRRHVPAACRKAGAQSRRVPAARLPSTPAKTTQEKLPPPSGLSVPSAVVSSPSTTAPLGSEAPSSPPNNASPPMSIRGTPSDYAEEAYNPSDPLTPLQGRSNALSPPSSTATSPLYSDPAASPAAAAASSPKACSPDGNCLPP